MKFKKITLLILIPMALSGMKRGRTEEDIQDDIQNRVVRQRTESPAPATASSASNAQAEDIIDELLRSSLSDEEVIKVKALSPLLEAAIDGNVDLVNKLLSESVNVNEVDDKGNTALHWAVMHEKLPVVESLLGAKADVNIKDNEGLTPLDLAIIKGNKEIVKLLLEHKANPNTQDYNLFRVLRIQINEAGKKELKNNLRNNKIYAHVNKTGYTPLMRAVINNDRDIVKLLLDKGASIYAKAVIIKENKPVEVTVFELAKDKDIQSLLSEKNKSLEALGNQWLFSAGRGNIGKVKKLLAAGVDVNARDKYNKGTPLISASINGHIDIVKLLIDACADVNAQNDYGATPLHEASANGHTDIVKLLLEACEDVNAANKNGYTPLRDASYFGHKDIVKLLIDAGADVNAADNGKTPLYSASNRGHKDIVELLINAGADVNVADNDGLTPVHEASRKGHKDLVKLLLEAGAYVKSTDKKRVEKLIGMSVYNYFKPHREKIALELASLRERPLPLVLGNIVSEYLYGGNS